MSEPSLANHINAIAWEIAESLDPGEVAELRRMRPADASCPAFWRIVAAHLEPAGEVPTGGSDRERAEHRWAAILAGMAALGGLHRPRARLGRSLAQAGVAEPRVLRLLRAHDDQLLDAVRMTVHQLATKAIDVDCADIAQLVLSDGRSDEESARRRIARDYYSITTEATSSAEGRQ